MAIAMQIVIDAADPARLAEFWALALAYRQQPPPPGFDTWEDFARSIEVPEAKWGDRAAVVDPAGVGPRVFFQRVPEGKTAKNRVHIDVSVSVGAADREQGWALVLAHVERLVGAGATMLREVPEPAGHCIVMRDPEGNEFCVQ